MAVGIHAKQPQAGLGIRASAREQACAENPGDLGSRELAFAELPALHCAHQRH